MNLEGTYQLICRSSDPAASIAAMRDDTLARLVAHLEGGGIQSGIPGIVLALCEQEAARRWVEDQLGKPGAVGEGAV